MQKPRHRVLDFCFQASKGVVAVPDTYKVAVQPHRDHFVNNSLAHYCPNGALG
jgi:hypothetical protein